MRLSPFIYCCWLGLIGIGGTLPRAAGQQALPKRVSAVPKPPLARRQTRFPDTLHAQPLEVRYWTSAQLDTLQAELGTTGQQITQLLGDSPARYRVFYEAEALRLFYRPLASTTQWLEVDLAPWLAGPSQPYLHAYVVDLDHHAPEEIMVKMGSGSYGSGYRTTIDQTLLLSLDGPPHLLWQSIDGRVEEVPPTRADKKGEMIGGNWAERRRTVAMRKGLVYVSSIHKSGKFEDPDPQLTPITPGYYQYQQGRFRRVTPPKSSPNPKRAHLTR
jgi:hypothetical protein